MINLKYSIALAIPLILSGCIIIDSDEVDMRSVSVVHEPGENTKAQQQASDICAGYGMTGARLVEIDDTDADGKARSLYMCR